MRTVTVFYLALAVLVGLRIANVKSGSCDRASMLPEDRVEEEFVTLTVSCLRTGLVVNFSVPDVDYSDHFEYAPLNYSCSNSSGQVVSGVIADENCFRCIPLNEHYSLDLPPGARCNVTGCHQNPKYTDWPGSLQDLFYFNEKSCTIPGPDVQSSSSSISEPSSSSFSEPSSSSSSEISPSVAITSSPGISTTPGVHPSPSVTPSAQDSPPADTLIIWLGASLSLFLAVMITCLVCLTVVAARRPRAERLSAANRPFADYCGIAVTQIDPNYNPFEDKMRIPMFESCESLLNKLEFKAQRPHDETILEEMELETVVQPHSDPELLQEKELPGETQKTFPHEDEPQVLPHEAKETTDANIYDLDLASTNPKTNDTNLCMSTCASSSSGTSAYVSELTISTVMYSEWALHSTSHDMPCEDSSYDDELLQGLSIEEELEGGEADNFEQKDLSSELDHMQLSNSVRMSPCTPSGQQH